MSIAIRSSNTACFNNNARWKRKGSDNEDKRNGEIIKKRKYAWYVTLENESTTPTEEDKESVYTVQGNETEFACDTSDISSHSWKSNVSEVSDDLKFEIVDSQSKHETANMSSSEPENILAFEFITFSDTEGFADDSDGSKSSVNSDIKKADFWSCIQCRNQNNNPLFPYCKKCYQMRKMHFSRNRPKQKPRLMKDQKNKSVVKTKILNSTVSSQDLLKMDSGLPSSQNIDKYISDSENSDRLTLNLPNSQGSMSSNNSQTETSQFSITGSQASGGDDVDSGLALMKLDFDDWPLLSNSGSNKLNYTKEKPEGTEVKLNKHSKNLQSFGEENGKVGALIPNNETEIYQEVQGSDSLCLICTVNPKNGAFVHSKITHICCCYGCAIKVWKSNGNRCPICNCKVTQVLKAFYV